MKKSIRRLMFALAASIVFHAIAMVTGLGGVVIEPVVTLVLVSRGPDGLIIALGFSVLAFTIVFWTGGTIWNMLREAWPATRNRPLPQGRR